RNLPRVGKNQCAFCKNFGHWKRECPKNKKGGQRAHTGRTIAHVGKD
ncbi:hypothetical protein FK519_29695, partial [Klebsiella pneumoniae]|nr:hypothetical protein [Klebsiella pneumoniae]